MSRSGAFVPDTGDDGVTGPVAAFLAERPQWPLWLPVWFGAGIAVYFTLPFEPPPWPALLLAGLSLVVGIVGRRRAASGHPWLLLAAIAVGMAAAGVVIAQLHTRLVAGPVIAARTGPVVVTGRLVGLEVFPAARRVTLDRVVVGDLAPDDTPRRIRIRIAGLGEGPDPVPGDRLRVRAVLLPPPGPAAPGAFDFQRHAWFRSIGGVGFSLGQPTILPGEGAGGLRLALERLRTAVAGRVRAALADESESAAVAVALLTGQRAGIDEAVTGAMRDSGLAHLLAISGLHIGLVAGLVFFVIRAGLALAPPVALRWPIRKWAAVAGIVGGFGYLMISGMTIPTQRAWLMLGLVFLAVIVDRTAISMRSVAWAALAVLLVSPSGVTGASFQMSFAAVISLVAAWEAMGPAVLRWRRRGDGGWWRGPLLWIGGIAFTTLVAGAATGVFAVWHFNRVAVYGVAANLVAVPLMAMWIMPWGVLALLLMPTGLEFLALVPMAAGIDAMLAVARTVAGWGGAAMLVPAMPVQGLVLIALGGLWLCLWRQSWRYWGLGGIALGLASIGLVSPPDLLVSGDGRLLAARSADGAYMLSTRRSGRFAADIWMRLAGDSEPADWPAEGASPDGRLSCDATGCIYRAAGHVVALARDGRALAEDCWLADVVISLRPVRMPCPSAGLVVDRFDLWREGGHALWLDVDEVRMETVNGVRGERPWVLRPISRREREARRLRGQAAGRGGGGE